MLTATEILGLMPQKPPFRFLDRLLEISEHGALGEVTFRREESFYAGHFPGNPVTPGVILVESMCQTGLVALGIHLLALEASRAELTRTITLFTDVEAEFLSVVKPCETLQIRAERLSWRRRKLKSRCQIFRDTELVAQAVVAGIGVLRTETLVEEQ